jgi:hypothetical protein
MRARHIQRMVNQLLDRVHEGSSMRQADVPLKCGFILPSRVYIKELPVTCGTKGMDAQAAGLLGCGSKNALNGVFNFCLLAGLRVKTREYEKLQRTPLRSQVHGCFQAYLLPLGILSRTTDFAEETGCP